MPDMLGPYPFDSIITGDARELAKAIPDESVDLIFTAPPYPREFLPLYGWLAETAARVLKPGGACLAMGGQSYLSNIVGDMSEHLTYHWVISIDMLRGQGGQAPTIWPRKVSSYWKPIVWFQKGEYTGARVSDVLASQANDKIYHKWGQSVGSNVACLLKFPAPFVLDPFCGGGTVPAVCKMLRRHYLAFEIDPDTAARARQRVLTTQAPLVFPEPEQIEMAYA